MRVGGLLDGLVEPVERFQELVAVEALADQGGDDLLDLGGDDVSAGEFRVVENFANQPLGEQVLDQHLIHGVACGCSGSGPAGRGRESQSKAA